MSPQTFAIRRVLNTSKANKKGLSPIYAMIRLNRAKTEISSKRNVIQENGHWKEKSWSRLMKPTTGETSTWTNFGTRFLMATIACCRQENLSGHSLRDAPFGGPVIQKRTVIKTAREHNTRFESQIGIRYGYAGYRAPKQL